MRATRTGVGGIVGQKRKYFSWRFAIDFAGGPLARIDRHTAKIEINISASSGRTEITSARPLDAIEGIRAMFDLVPTESTDPITLRAYLSQGGKALSETWLYEWTPPAVGERRLL